MLLVSWRPICKLAEADLVEICWGHSSKRMIPKLNYTYAYTPSLSP